MTRIWSLQLLLQLVVWLCSTLSSLGDIVVENDIIKPEEIYDFVVLQDSEHWWEATNTTKYYCIMRGLWNNFNHPKRFPTLARMANPVIYSSTKQYLPWLKNRQTTYGVEKVAETGFTDTFLTETSAAGQLVYDLKEGKGFFVDQEDPEKNYGFLPGVKVNRDFPFLSGLAGMLPSPDWFTGFYLLDVIDEYDRTYWNRMIIHTYPWDAGTDAGKTYMSVDQDLDPAKEIYRIYRKETSDINGIFLSPDGRTVRPTAEWDCILHICGQNEEDCDREHWPPANGCDVLKWPGCEFECDPETEVCQECKPKEQPQQLGLADADGDGEQEVRRIFYRNCCQSNHEPLHSTCVAPPNSGASDVRAGMWSVFILGLPLLVAVLV